MIGEATERAAFGAETAVGVTVVRTGVVLGVVLAARVVTGVFGLLGEEVAVATVRLCVETAVAELF